jgi:hypothetical protein
MERVFAELARVVRDLRTLPDGISGQLNGRPVQAQRIAGATVEWVVLRTAVCAAAELDLALVLERNARLAFAALALSNGVYWVRIALPGDSAELADPARVIAMLVEAAESLVPRQEISNGAAFAHWAA